MACLGVEERIWKENLRRMKVVREKSKFLGFWYKRNKQKSEEKEKACNLFSDC